MAVRRTKMLSETLRWRRHPPMPWLSQFSAAWLRRLDAIVLRVPYIELVTLIMRVLLGWVMACFFGIVRDFSRMDSVGTIPAVKKALRSVRSGVGELLEVVVRRAGGIPSKPAAVWGLRERVSINSLSVMRES